MGQNYTWNQLWRPCRPVSYLLENKVYRSCRALFSCGACSQGEGLVSPKGVIVQCYIYKGNVVTDLFNCRNSAV